MIKMSEKQKTEIIVIDNFYDNPRGLRAEVMKRFFYRNNDYYKGARTTDRFVDDAIKTRFESILRKTITKWDYDTNGVFQFCIAEDPLVYHMDSQKWAGIVYLTENAPVQTGTSFYQSKTNTTFRRDPRSEHEWLDDENAHSLVSNIFRGGFYDRSNFDLVDTIGNVFNRLVLWDAKMIHAASQYFGTQKENARLFQMFFFDAE